MRRVRLGGPGDLLALAGSEPARRNPLRPDYHAFRDTGSAGKTDARRDAVTGAAGDIAAFHGRRRPDFGSPRGPR